MIQIDYDGNIYRTCSMTQHQLIGSMKEEEIILNQFNGFLCVLGVLFLSLFAIGVDTAVNAEVHATDIPTADYSKTEAGYVHQENIDTAAIEGGIRENGGNNNPLAPDDSFTYELSQNDKEVESTDAKDETADTAEEQGVTKESGHGVVFEPVQYCQGRFKRLGGTGVEIITVRCPKVDDSCNCEADKKSPTKWIECGGARKDSTIGSDLLSCESKIIGSGPTAESE